MESEKGNMRKWLQERGERERREWREIGDKV